MSTTPWIPEAGSDRGALDPLAEHTARIRSALQEVHAADPEVDPETAARLLSEVEAAIDAGGRRRDERKLALWGDLARARADHKRYEAGIVDRPPRPSRATITALERLHQDLVEAEAAARRKLAGPAAFKRFVALRRQLEGMVADAGGSSYEELVASAADDQSSSGDDLASAAARLAQAEAAWAAFEGESQAVLPNGAEGDAIRARGYRLLGEVVEDEELIARLGRAVELGERRQAAMVLLSAALHDVGLAPGDRAVEVGERYLWAAEGPTRSTDEA